MKVGFVIYVSRILLMASSSIEDVVTGDVEMRVDDNSKVLRQEVVAGVCEKFCLRLVVAEDELMQELRCV